MDLVLNNLAVDPIRSVSNFPLIAIAPTIGTYPNQIADAALVGCCVGCPRHPSDVGTASVRASVPELPVMGRTPFHPVRVRALVAHQT